MWCGLESSPRDPSAEPGVKTSDFHDLPPQLSSHVLLLLLLILCLVTLLSLSPKRQVLPLPPGRLHLLLVLLAIFSLPKCGRGFCLQALQL